MAFTLYASCNNETLQLNDGAPFRFETLEEASNPVVVRLSQRGPLQHGVSDLGYRLGARTLVLNLLFYAGTASLLDTYRQTLTDYFAPQDASVFLYATRDDGVIRRLTCKPVDEIDIALVPEHYPGHLHRARVTLRCANPLWLDATVVQSTLANIDQRSWWTAGGTISLSNVMEYLEYPTQGQAWTYAGTINGSWTIAFRSGTVPTTGTPVAFHAGTGAVNSAGINDVRYYYAGTTFKFDPNEVTGQASLTAGTHNDLITHAGNEFDEDSVILYRDGASAVAGQAFEPRIAGTARRWRSDKDGNSSTYWASEMPKVALYNTELNSAQLNALSAWMDGTAFIAGTIGTTNTAPVVNSGDLPSYPVIRFTGPLSNPILVNSTTGGSLNLTGLTLGTSEICTVDLRDGNKQILDANGNNLLGSLTYPHHLAQWFLAPSPTASGGTNTVVLTVTGPGTATRALIEHYNQYLSF